MRVPLPDRDAPELDWLLFEQSQVLSRDQAMAEVGRGALQNLLKSGRWQRAARGVVVAHNGPLTRTQQLWVAALGAGGGAVCAGLTAAILGGLRGYERDNMIDLLVPGNRQLRPTAGVRVHRTDVLPAEHVRERAAPPCTTMARSILDAAAWARTDNDARAIVAAAFQQGRVAKEEIDAVAATLRRSRRRALVLETANYSAGGAHSLSEVDLMKLCRRFGLPLPDLQTERTDVKGRTRYLDAYWREWRVHVEVDGSFHLEARTWWADMQRQNDLWIRGDRVLRFPAWVVAHRPGEVAAQIRRALEAAGWTGRL